MSIAGQSVSLGLGLAPAGSLEIRVGFRAPVGERRLRSPPRPFFTPYALDSIRMGILIQRLEWTGGLASARARPFGASDLTRS
jgi:hypothetical protein